MWLVEARTTFGRTRVRALLAFLVSADKKVIYLVILNYN